jgi:sugar/nucleoside kinase (ribokinase family)
MDVHYQIIGHVCHDDAPDGKVLGGTAAYAAAVATHFGALTSIITSVGSDFLFEKFFKERNITVINIPAEQTTNFENIYQGENRVQYLHHIAETISFEALERVALPYRDILHYGPICDEIDFNLIPHLQAKLKIATIQGWLRKRSAEGKVLFKEIDAANLMGLDIIICSDEDVLYNNKVIKEYLEYVPNVIETKGSKGAIWHQRGKSVLIPAIKVQNVKKFTGAGDTFATVFAINYLKSNNFVESISLAHTYTSFLVEGSTLDCQPNLEDVWHRHKTNQER